MGRLATFSKKPLALFWLLCVSACSMVQAEDHNIAYKLLQKGEILSLETILQINHKQIPGEILQVELEREKKQLIYEIEVLNDNGVVWKYKIDAKTAEIIEKEQD
ncbi:MAG TPA: hypothetical protein ENJ41_02740 [Oceanospirillales bacterium]|nr:hypothetical protein [Oceanospirillales bacterium]